MTLVLGYISDQHAILASDRRISWVDTDGKIATREDTENKAIVLAGQFIMGYTGFARLGRAGVKTEQWVCETLAGVTPQDYWRTLAAQTEAAIAELRVPLNRSGHAFLAAGFAFTPSSPSRLEAYMVTISNALTGRYGGWRPQQRFEAGRMPPLSSSSDFRMQAVGITPARSDIDTVIDAIVRYRKRFPSRALGIAQVMVDLIRRTAVQDAEGRIGLDVSVSILPREAVPAQEAVAHVGGIQEPISQLTCVFVPADRDVEHALVYMPASVSPGMASFGGEFWVGTPPPWWKGSTGQP
jgi:hypothetical protein